MTTYSLHNIFFDQPVGCDGILGSDKHYDSCHRCSKDDKDNEDCKKFKNTLTITNNSEFTPQNTSTIISVCYCNTSV